MIFYLKSPTIMVDCHPILDMLFLCYPTMFGTLSPEIISKISTFQSIHGYNVRPPSDVDVGLDSPQ